MGNVKGNFQKMVLVYKSQRYISLIAIHSYWASDSCCPTLPLAFVCSSYLTVLINC